jgi:hypothetical protein
MTAVGWEHVPVLALTHETGTRIAEIGFLLIIFAGIFLAVSEIPKLGLSKARGIVVGLAIAVAGLLLIIAVHWGHFN